MNPGLLSHLIFFFPLLFDVSLFRPDLVLIQVLCAVFQVQIPSLNHDGTLYSLISIRESQFKQGQKSQRSTATYTETAPGKHWGRYEGWVARSPLSTGCRVFKQFVFSLLLPSWKSHEDLKIYHVLEDKCYHTHKQFKVLMKS